MNFQLSLAFVGFFVLFAEVLALRLRAAPGERRLVAIGLAAMALVVGTVVVLLVQHDVPNGWVTPLREGLTSQTVQRLYGRVPSSGPLHEALVDFLSAGDPAPVALRSLVRMNLGVTAANVVLFACIAWAVTRRWIATAFFTLFFAVSPAVTHAAVSELSSPLIVLFFLVGFIAAATFQQLPEGGSRWPPLVLLAASAILATLCRAEMVVVGAPAVALATMHQLLGAERASAWLEPFRSAARSALRWPPWVHLVGLAVSLALLLVRLWDASSTHGFHGLLPWNPSIVSLPLALSHVMPLSAVVLAVLGLVHAFRRIEAFLLFPVSMVVLYRTYVAGSHGLFGAAFHELFRYSTVFTPLMMVVALFGWRELESLAGRLSWNPGWRRGAVAALVLLSFAQTPPGHREALYGHYSHHDEGQHFGLLSRDMQRELRFLLDGLDARPECVVVTRVMGPVYGPGGPGSPRLLLFGGHLRASRELPFSDEPLATVIRRVEPRSKCARYFRGLDCHHELMTGCDEDAAGLTLEWERKLRHLPYTSVDEYGRFDPDIRLAFYDLPLPPAPRRVHRPTGPDVARTP